MNPILRHLVPVSSALVILALHLVGCASHASPASPVEEKGFGFETSQLYTSTTDSIVWSLAEARETRYQELLVDTLTFRLDDDSIARVGGTDDNARALRDAFRETFESRLGPLIPIVDHPTGSALQIVPAFVDRVRLPELESLKNVLTSNPQGKLPRVCLELTFYRYPGGDLVAAAVSQRDAHLFELALRGELDEAGMRRIFSPLAHRLRLALEAMGRSSVGE